MNARAGVGTRTPGAPPEPARCAGLRHALMHGWTRGFPLRDAPFQVLARHVGGTVREVLGHCQGLSEAGALDAIRVRWSPALERVHWRCGLAAGGRPMRDWLAALAVLPGVTQVDWIEPDGSARDAGGPTLWFDLVARDAAAAAAQRAHFEAAHGPLLCLGLEVRDPPLPPAARPPTAQAPGTARAQPARPASGAAEFDGCHCRVAGGPCSDPDLARLCEAGLPLRAHPFRSLSDAVHRSEREVLCTLRHWQRTGVLQDLGLAPPPDRHESLWTVVAVGDGPAAIDAGMPAALLSRPGIGEVRVLPGHPRWPWRLLVGAAGAAPQTAPMLRRALAACGLDGHPQRAMRVHRVVLRAAPLLFAAVDGVAAAGHAAA